MPNLEGVLTCLKEEEIKPNFSELSRIYGKDRRTIKKMYDGIFPKTTRNKKSKLDPYLDIIIEKMSLPQCNKMSVYMYIKMNACNDIGSYSNFRKYVAKHSEIELAREKAAHVLYETEYGKQLQFDWKGPITLHNKHGKEFEFYIFSATLSASRFHVFRYSNFMTKECVEKCLIETFNIIGGVPDEALTDNMSSIISYGNGSGFCSEFKAFAKDMGIDVAHCKPYRPFTKGKDESCNRFVNWINPYEGEFETEEDLIKIFERINTEVNKQINQATGMPPLSLFRKEKEYLRPLPNRKVMNSYLDTLTPVKVANTSLIYWKGKNYSVPTKYINQTVKVKEFDNKLYVYYNKELIKMHVISEFKINYDEKDYISGLASVMPDKDANFIEEMAKHNLELLDQKNQERNDYIEEKNKQIK